MTHTGEKPFACEVCDYRFWSKSGFLMARLFRPIKTGNVVKLIVDFDQRKNGDSV